MRLLRLAFFAFFVSLSFTLGACSNPPGDGPAGHSDAGDAGIGDGSTNGDGTGADGADGAAMPPFVCSAPLDGTTATLFYDAARCLFEGSDPPQRGVPAGTIDRERVAIVRGRVLDTAGVPLAGVRVSVLKHAEYGSTSSRTDGRFELAVNGGAVVTLRYEKNDYLLSQRHMRTEWRLFTVFPDVALLPESGEKGEVTLSGATTIVRGPKTTDASGSRQPWVLFSPRTTASMVLPDGTKEPLAAFHFRMTEYSVGERGPLAMPGDLPASSGYTYAAAFSVDEATARGAARVEFDPPVVTYVDNFLRFPAGTVVPAGAYDEQRDVWEASDSGQVVQIVSVANGLAEVDSDGDGNADDATKLSKLGIDDDERRALGESYAAGQSAWRVKLAHFSSWDLNWPFSPPKDAIAAFSEVFGPWSLDCKTTSSGSIIGCEDQSLGEAVAVEGTPFTLHYQSERTAGRLDGNEITILLSGSTIPPSVKRIELEVEVLGQVTKKSYPPSANLRDIYRWDGKDAWGRSWQGGQLATVRVGYVYDGAYEKTTRFGYSGKGIPITGDKARSEVTLWRVHRVRIGTMLAEPLGLGGFSLSAQHTFDPRGATLYLGNGHRRSAEAIGNIITTVAGTGLGGSVGDDGPAKVAQINRPHGLVVGPDGTVFYSGETEHRIRKISPSGVITNYAGTGVAGLSGDGDVATSAQLSAPMGLALDKDGTLYVADSGNARVRAISPAGIITTIAGGGDPLAAGKTMGEGGPAIKAVLVTPHALALGSDGVLYIADYDGHTIQAVGVDGIIHKFAGGGTLSGADADGHPALEINVGDPLGLTMGPEQELYFADHAGNRVRKIDANGTVSTIVGGGTGTADGILASDSAIAAPHTVDRSLDGSLYITEEGKDRIRRVRPDGIIETVAGGGTPPDTLGDNGPAVGAKFALPRIVYVHRDGSLWIADYDAARIRRVQAPMPGFTTTEFAIASTDGAVVYAFDDHGRHLRTVDALTGVVLLQFAYDSAGLLASVVDPDGNRTTVERDGVGRPTSITGPFGQKTALVVGTDGYLATIADANGSAVAFTYKAGGLLETTTDPRGGSEIHRFSYDDVGRLLKDRDPSGYEQTLTRSATLSGSVVALRTTLGRTRTHETERTPEGADRTVLTTPDGQSTATLRTPSGATITTPTATTKVTYVGDTRFGMQSPLVSTVEIQQNEGGPKVQVTRKRDAVLAVASDPLSVQSITDTSTINGRRTIVKWDRALSTIKTTSATDRVATFNLDERGRVVGYQMGELAPVSLVYDDRGRLKKSTAGDRVAEWTFDASGRPATLTDPVLRTTGFTYDAGGRPTRITLVDQNVLAIGYDANDNVTSITPPGGAAHGFSYGAANLLSAYLPPAAADTGSNQTVYTYNEDKQVAKTVDPAGRNFAATYDAQSGRPTALALAGTQIDLTYDTAGRVGSAALPDESITFGYQGDLPTSVAWEGAVAGQYSRVYDVNFFIQSDAVNGATIAYQYDGDGRLLRAGDETLTYDRTGLLLDAIAGKVQEHWWRNTFGESEHTLVKASAQVALETWIIRDKLGRIATRTESALAATKQKYDYRYDERGRLVEVLRDGASLGTYRYDANGNRIDATGVAATYDAQDRLLTAGDTRYAYGAAGQLAAKTAPSGTTSYTYDIAGNLKAVTLPDGTAVEYVIDPVHRRVGKKVNGALVQGLLYRDALAPVAELDAQGNVAARFVYGTRDHVPDLVIKAGGTYRIFSDEQGSPRFVVNTATGEIAEQLTYDAWGNVLSDSNPGFQPFGFAGGLYDRDTGFVRYGARDYDPTVGRWTDKDPSGFAGGSNHYLYANGDPVNYIDVDGRNPILIGIAIGAASGAFQAALVNATLQMVMQGCIDWGQVGHEALIGAGVGAVTGGVAGWARAGRAAAGGVASDARLFELYKSELAAQEIEGAKAVGSALKSDSFHRAASFVVGDVPAGGRVFTIGGRTGSANLTQVLGELNGSAGRFEWIVDTQGNLTHQMFVRGGTINGIPIVP